MIQFNNNTSINKSHDSMHDALPQYSKITKWIALTETIGIIALNLTVIVLLARKKKPSRMAFFVHHLAVADMCVGLLYVLPECIFDRFLKKWETYTCYILYGYCANLTVYGSTFLIVVLTIDRMLVIVKPVLATTRGSWYRYGLVSGAWCLAAVFTIPYVCHVQLIYRDGEILCKHNFGRGIYAMVIVEIVLTVLIPVCIITICYVRMISVIWKRETIGLSGMSKYDTDLSTHTNVLHGAKTKTIKLLFVIVIVYILSWTPLNVAQVMNTFDYMDVGSSFVFLHVLAPINSLMNPIVFLIFNQQMFFKRRCNTDFTQCDNV